MILPIFQNIYIYHEQILKYGWSIESFNSDVKNTVQKIGIALTIFSYTVLFSFIAGANMFMAFTPAGENVISYVRELYEQYLGDYYIIAIFFNYVFSTVSSFCIAYIITLTAIVIFQVSIQYLLMSSYIDQLKEYKADLNSLYDRNYQVLVKTVLRECVKKHVDIIRYCKPAMRFQVHIIMYIVIMGFLLCLTCGVVLLGDDSYYKHDIKVLILLIGLIFIIYAHCYCGEYKDMAHSKFYNSLCNADWYNWNQSNKKTYLIMLHKSAMPWTLMSFFNVARINYAFGLSFFRLVYQVAAVFMNFRS
ncbi:uncharacterized protein [Diabrotica undecimpunctata]|uniref:uncharacterized protein n=1 Tax=Diabrotica undecimpunctata TaxID=50387 RepID=UPI003B642222